MSFENIIFKSNFYSGLLSFGIKLAFFAAFVYILLAFFAPHIAKKFFSYIKMYMNIAKLITCVLIVLLIFCFDYKTKQIVFFVSLENMSFSTFSVGALALWELISMATELLSVINDILPDEKY